MQITNTIFIFSFYFLCSMVRLFLLLQFTHKGIKTPGFHVQSRWARIENRYQDLFIQILTFRCEMSIYLLYEFSYTFLLLLNWFMLVRPRKTTFLFDSVDCCIYFGTYYRCQRKNNLVFLVSYFFNNTF